jgi:hypothetical protein
MMQPGLEGPDPALAGNLFGYRRTAVVGMLTATLHSLPSDGETLSFRIGPLPLPVGRVSSEG